MATVNQDGSHHENSKIMRIVKRFGMDEIELKEAFAGDIISLAGFNNSTVGNIINEIGKDHVIPSIPIDPPMLSLTITLNDSPLKG
jgi:GTP-binding protein